MRWQRTCATIDCGRAMLKKLKRLKEPVDMSPQRIYDTLWARVQGKLGHNKSLTIEEQRWLLNEALRLKGKQRG